MVAIVERLPGTLLDFWLQFGDMRYCLFTVTGFLRDLLRVCLWLEQHQLFCYDFKLENFFIRESGRLVLGDLDSVFELGVDGDRSLRRVHEVRPDDVLSRRDTARWPSSPPEVLSSTGMVQHGAAPRVVTDYSKAHTWSCGALILQYLTAQRIVAPSVHSAANVKQLSDTVHELLDMAGFVACTGHAKTDRQGAALLSVLRGMMHVNPRERPSTEEALREVDGVHDSAQRRVDFEAKYGVVWRSRYEGMLSGACPSANPLTGDAGAEVPRSKLDDGESLQQFPPGSRCVGNSTSGPAVPVDVGQSY